MSYLECYNYICKSQKYSCLIWKRYVFPYLCCDGCVSKNVSFSAVKCNPQSCFKLPETKHFKVQKKILSKESFMVPFYGWGSAVSRIQSHYQEAVYFVPLSS